MEVRLRSPSAWRVWIEILYKRKTRQQQTGHPPHGGCGLKYLTVGVHNALHDVTLRMEGVD